MLWEFVLLTFLGQVALKDEANQTLWNAVFSVAVSHINYKHRNKGITRYTLTRELLMKNISYEAHMRLVKALAAMDVWLPCIAAVLKVNQGFVEVMPILKTGDTYLLTYEGSPV